MGKWTGKTCRLLSMMCLTTTFFLVEIIVGYVTNSLALVADAFHMLSDVVALFVGFSSVRVSKWSSSKNTFGWARAEVMGALVNSVFLIALCFSIFIESLQRFFEREEVEQPKLLLVVGGIGLLVNLIGIILFREHAHSHSGGGHSHGKKNKKKKANKGKENGNQEQQSAAVPYASSNDGASVIDLPIAPSPSHTHSDQKPPKGAKRVDETSAEGDYISATGTPLPPEDIPVDSAANDTEKQLFLPKEKLKVTFPRSNENVPVCDSDERDNNQQKNLASSAQLNMRGVFLHVLGDALGSVVVCISASLIWAFEEKYSWIHYVDPLLSLILVVIILSTTIPLFRESSMILMQTVPTHIQVQDLQEKLINKVEGVLAVHEFHVWRLAGSRIIASAHISCHDVSDYMRIAEEVKEFFHHEGIHSTTIQPEFVEKQSIVSNMVGSSSSKCVLQCGPERSCFTDTCCGTTGNNQLTRSKSDQNILRQRSNAPSASATVVENLDTQV